MAPQRYTTFLIIVSLIFLFSIPTLLGLFHQGMFISDDGTWMIIRFSAFYETLKSFQIPVRFIERLNNGYGYPLSNFMYPGFLYLGVPIHMVGFGFISTIKIIFGLSLVSSSIFIFYWLQNYFSKTVAFIASIFSLYAPYHLFDLYSRGSIGEMLALSAASFVLWQIKKQRWFWVAFGIAAVILSHNIIAFLFLPIFFGYIFITIKENRIFKKVLFSCFPITAALGLSAFFWFPALFDLQYTQFTNTQIANWRYYFANLSLIGISSFAIITCSLLGAIKEKKFLKKSFSFFWISTIIYLLLSLSVTTTVWQIIPAEFIQFPFRFLSVVFILCSFLFGFFLSVVSKKYQLFVGLTFLLITFFDSRTYLFPLAYSNNTDEYYATNFSTTTIKNEYMPIWVKIPPSSYPRQKVEIVKGDGRISDMKKNASAVAFAINANSKNIVQINTIYYPGWKVYINGKESNIQYDNQYGVMQIMVEKGNHKVEVKFEETVPRLLADIISLITGVSLLAIYIRKRYGKIFS